MAFITGPIFHPQAHFSLFYISLSCTNIGFPKKKIRRRGKKHRPNLNEFMAVKLYGWMQFRLFPYIFHEER